MSRPIHGLFLLLSAQLAGMARATLLEGELPENDRYFAEYVGKFCYDYTDTMQEVAGKLSVDVRREGIITPINRDAGRLYFLIFDDERAHWKRIRTRWNTATCEEKIQTASLVVEMMFATDMAVEANHSAVIHEHIRPRFWYFTFVNCGMDFGLSRISYSVHATNSKQGWESEFSVDHAGLYAVYLVTTVAFFMVGYGTTWVAKNAGSGRDLQMREHPYIQLLTLTFVSSVASGFLFLMHYSLLIRNGRGSLRLRFLAVFAGTVATCTMYLIAILSSCGWAISIASLPNRRSFLTLVTVVGSLHALCELHAQTTLDQSSKLYAYQGGVGMFALVLKMFVFCWFAFQVKASYEDELHERKRRFYKYLGISVSLWAITLPVVVILAWELSPWVRYKVVTGVEVVARFVGLCLLTQLFIGPLTPISSENTFQLRGHQDADLADGKEHRHMDFGQLPG